MKKAYGDFKYRGNAEFLKSMLIKTREDFDDLFEKIKNTIINEGGTEEEAFGWLFEEIAIRDWEYNARTGFCDHYFFTGDNFNKWLENTACPIIGDQCEIMKDFFDRTIAGINKLSKTEQHRPIMFHFKPGDCPAILLGLRIDAVDRFHLVVLDGKLQAHFFIPDDENQLSDPVNKPVLKIRNLISSAVAYISCFPDTVKSGIPDDLKNPAHFRKSKCFSVGVSHKIYAGNTHQSPVPHYRIGHWRYLKSDRYKNKKGQTIFVTGTFVKGKATTVLSPDDAIS
jgi:hypothetical protein